MKTGKDVAAGWLMSLTLLPMLLDQMWAYHTQFFAVKWVVLLLFPAAAMLFGFQRSKPDLLFFSASGYLFSTVASTLSNSGMSDESLSHIFPFVIAYMVFVAVYFSKRDFLGHYVRFLRIVLEILLLLSLPLTFAGEAFEQGRFNGIFFNANATAGLFALFFAMLLPEIDETSGGRKLYLLALLAGNVYVVYLTQSRWSLAVMINLALAHILLLGAATSWPAWLRLLIGLGTATLSLDFALSPNSFAGLNIGGRSILDLSNRLHIFEAQMAAFREAPIFGAGLVIDPFTSGARYGGELSYTDILSYSGVLGMSLMAIAAGQTITGLLRRGRLAAHYLYPLLVVLLLSVFEGYISNVGGVLSLIIWFYFAGAHHPGPYALRAAGPPSSSVAR